MEENNKKISIEANSEVANESTSVKTNSTEEVNISSTAKDIVKKSNKKFFIILGIVAVTIAVVTIIALLFIYGVFGASFLKKDIEVKEEKITCTKNGEKYLPGEQVVDNFPDDDGCNICTCSFEGNFSCATSKCQPEDLIYPDDGEEDNDNDEEVVGDNEPNVDFNWYQDEYIKFKYPVGWDAEFLTNASAPYDLLTIKKGDDRMIQLGTGGPRGASIIRYNLSEPDRIYPSSDGPYSEILYLKKEPLIKDITFTSGGQTFKLASMLLLKDDFNGKAVIQEEEIIENKTNYYPITYRYCIGFYKEGEILFSDIALHGDIANEYFIKIDEEGLSDDYIDFAIFGDDIDTEAEMDEMNYIVKTFLESVQRLSWP